MASFKIDGVNEIQRAFRELEPKLAKKVIRQAIRKGLKPVLAAARRNAPSKSGALRKLIKIKAAAKRRRGVISLTVNIAGNRQGKAFYGAFNEYGTSRIKARHFMAAAFEETKVQAAEIAKREILDGIEREAKS